MNRPVKCGPKGEKNVPGVVVRTEVRRQAASGQKTVRGGQRGNAKLEKGGGWKGGDGLSREEQKS